MDTKPQEVSTSMADINTAQIIAYGSAIAAVASSWAITKYQVGELTKSHDKLVKEFNDDISAIRNEVRCSVDQKEFDAFKREFNSFKGDIKSELREIKGLLRNPQTGTSVFMLRSECGQHEQVICNLIQDIKDQLAKMDRSREQARIEHHDMEKRRDEQVNMLWTDVATLKTELKTKKDDGK